jgi:hypothetical protein
MLFSELSRAERKNVAGHLRRLVKPKLGKMIASDVTRQEHRGTSA